MEVRDDNLLGNERFQGYIVDLMKLLSKELGFRYILRLVRDDSYGWKDPEHGTWKGMIGEVMRQVCRILSADNWIFHMQSIGLIGTIAFL